MKKTVTQLIRITMCFLLLNTGFSQLHATSSEDAKESIEAILNENRSLSYSAADLNDGNGPFDSSFLKESFSLNSFEDDCTAVGGELTVNGPTTVCKSDGIDDSFTLSVEGASGENQVFVATLLNGQILLITDESEINLEGIPGNGTCLFWSLSWDGEIQGAEVGLNANDLMGDCFELSNPVPVTEYFTNGGEISTEDPTTICALDGEADPINVTLEGAEGENMAWVITDADLNILDLPMGPPFDLEGAGEGLCIIWHLSWSGELNGAAVGENAGNLSGDCFDLSNPIEVTRYVSDGGEISTEDPTTICALDGEADPINVTLEGAEGENMAWVITDADLNILDLPMGPPFDLEGAGEGLCIIWHLSWSGELNGAAVGENAGNLSGDCFDLSNPIEVTRYVSDGGEISTEDPTTICALDGEADPINVTLEGAEGENMAWVITDADLNILDLPMGPPFDLEGAGEGLCIIWHLSWSGELNGAAVGENAGNLSGDCFDLSNPIEVTRYVSDGGEISTDDETTICVGDGIGDPIEVTLEGAEGENMAWVITDADLNILDLPMGPPFDLEGAGVGVCLIWHLSWSGELNGAAVGENAGNLSGDCFDLSNPIEVTREECCTADGGELTVDGPSPVCKSDGEPDIFTLSVEGAVGENQAFVATFTDGEIILITNNTQLNLEGFPGNQACLFWHLSWDGEIEGAEVGLNAFDITGDCFDLSNSVEVIEYFTNGGEISTDDETTICALDGEADPINVTLEGAEGENMAWVITDAELNILDLPMGPPFDLEGAGEGLCIIWHLSWSGELNGAAVGENAGNLSGDCFDLSNPIEVTRYVSDGGEISTEDPTTICALDGEADPINVTLEGAEGENMAWVITDAELNILDLPMGPPFDLEGAGEGLCIIWHLSWSGELNGAAVGENAGNLSGDCFDLSNPIEVTRYVSDGGEISTEDPTTICALDGEADPINVTLEGAEGENMAWVITDADLNILDLPMGPPFDLEGAGEGLCIIWHLSWSGELNGAAVGENAGNLSGDCFDLSNPIEVTRYVSDGGEISTDDETTICVGDGIGDPIDVTLEGAEGENMAWVITDADLNILDLPMGPPFDLDGAGVGVCLIWHLSWSGELNGAAVGENAGNLSGDCFDLSNPIEVNREECDPCTAEGGELTVDGPTTICKSDGIDDNFTLNVEGAEGENQAFVVTWLDGEIILISDNNEFNLEGIPGNGVCLFWNLSWDGEIIGAEVGLNAFDLEGDCFDLSNPVEITEYFTDGGEIGTNDPTTICAGDGNADPINVTLEGEQGENMAWVITDADLNILDLPMGPPFDLEGAGEGLCIIWHLSWSGELNGAAVGENAGNLSGDCFDLSNPIEVTRYVSDGGEISTDDPTTICALDGEADPINVTLEGAEGENMAWVITDAELNILDLPMGPPFDLEGAGEGLCIIWHLSWSGELNGAAVGENAGNLSGDCFDLSNPIEVTRYVSDGGEISTEDPTTICALDGEADPINVTLEGAEGENMAWVITDADLNILDLPMGPPFDLEGAGEGLCIIWHLSWSGELNGAAVGENAGNLSGDCFDLSNPIEVTRYVSDGGEISTDDETTICVGDGIGDPIEVTLEGAEGENMAWVITDADLNILDLPMGPPFDLEGAGVGVCLIWHLSWSGELNGAAVGENAGNLSGDCFDLSNPIEVNREECNDCTAVGGELTVDGPTTVCKSDGVDDNFTLVVTGNEGENQAYVVTWLDGEIILISESPEFNLEGIPGNGTCLFWSLSWDGEIEGAEVGLNADDLMGDCFELSNPVPVTEYFTNGGEISTNDDTTICVGDGIADPINVTLVGDQGQNNAWVITDADLNILDLPMGPPFDLEGAGTGTCLIWNLSWSGELDGAMVGENAANLSGDCFDLSNSIAVERIACVPLVASTWKYELSMAPNPTDGLARVSYTSNQDAQTSISVYNLNGQRVEVLLDQNTEAGVKYMLPFDGNNLPSGIYMYQISNGKEVKMQKFVIAR